MSGAGTDAEWQGSFAQYYQFRDKARTLAGIGIYATVGMNVDTPSGANRPLVALVSASTNALVGTRAVLGRPLQAADNDPAAPNVAVLSHGYWQRRFGGDPDVVGLSLRLDAGPLSQVFGQPDAPYEVVGVLAPEAALPGTGRGADAERPDIWLRCGSPRRSPARIPGTSSPSSRPTF